MTMIASGKPKKQRFFRFNAPMHVRQRFSHAHLDKALRARLNIKKSSIQISKGDTVKIMAGSKKGTSGKVTRVNLRTGRIFIDSLVKKNARGKEFNVGISVNNVYITDLNLTDKIRAAKLKVAQQKKTTKITGPTGTDLGTMVSEPKKEEEKNQMTQHTPHTISETLKQG